MKHTKTLVSLWGRSLKTIGSLSGHNSSYDDDDDMEEKNSENQWKEKKR